MLHDVSLGDWHPRYDVPETAEASKQKMESLEGIDLLISEICDAGRLPFGHDKLFNIALTNGERDGDGLWAFAKRLRGLKYRTSKSMAGELRKEWGCMTSWHSGEKSGIVFPELLVLRGLFEVKYGRQEWSMDAEEWLEPAKSASGGF